MSFLAFNFMLIPEIKKVGKGGKCQKCEKDLHKGEVCVSLELKAKVIPSSNRGFFHQECFAVFCDDGLRLLKSEPSKVLDIEEPDADYFPR